MKSVVIELQKEALDPDASVSQLCRKAYAITRKLNLVELREWLECELNGYGENIDIPEYRQVSVEVKAWNLYHGWQPVYFNDSNDAEALSNTNITQRVAEIESLLRTEKEGTVNLQIPFSPSEQNFLSQAIGRRTQVTRMLSDTAVVRILDAVRNIILNWALKMEEDGIMGDDMVFTENERSEAIKDSYNVNNFYGEVSSPNIQQGTSNSVQTQITKQYTVAEVKNITEEIRNGIKQMNLDPEVMSELDSEIITLEAQAQSPKPKQTIVRESLGSVKRILEGAGGSVAAQLLLQLFR